MKKIFCDNCNRESTINEPVVEYDFRATLNSIKESDAEQGLEYCLEVHTIEICQMCATKIANACVNFCRTLMGGFANT